MPLDTSEVMTDGVISSQPRTELSTSASKVKLSEAEAFPSWGLLEAQHTRKDAEARWRFLKTFLKFLYTVSTLQVLLLQSRQREAEDLRLLRNVSIELERRRDLSFRLSWLPPAVVLGELQLGTHWAEHIFGSGGGINVRFTFAEVPKG